MQDRPTAIELLQAARDFCERELGPSLTGRMRFQVRVLQNILGTLEREWDQEEDALIAEWGRLKDVLGENGARPDTLKGLGSQVREWNVELAKRIRTGDLDDRSDELLAMLTRDDRGEDRDREPGLRLVGDLHRGLRALHALSPRRVRVVIGARPKRIPSRQRLPEHQRRERALRLGAQADAVQLPVFRGEPPAAQAPVRAARNRRPCRARRSRAPATSRSRRSRGSTGRATCRTQPATRCARLRRTRRGRARCAAV